ncbi:DUF2865 domain-containing protein [Bradyrhizobium sp. LB11.1]|uniref:DUF2865 domain-containing protein n=1 Tax=Bradyrhizobium sp. LB11.1 TaxID=3156326 RepID=UPI0033987C83
MADMPEFLSLSRPRSLLACTVLLSAIVFATDAFAQAGPPGGPPPPAQGGLGPNPMCVRLEAQLAGLDRGASGDPARDDQIRRYQESQSRQQAELDRVTMQAKRMGCDSSGFFSLFSGQSAQCGPVNTQIQQMRANLDQITGNLERLRGGSPERDSQRRSVLIALAQNNCGPQYANAAQSQGGNFLSNLFGGGNNPNNPQAVPPPDLGPQSGTYRTVCVRTCDGAYFPISFATVPARFPDDERTCKALCPAAEAVLYAHRNPGEDMNSAVSISGQPYTALPTAFKFRTEFNPSCSCKAAGQSWADALKSADDKAAVEQQGDIIVTEESAKKMQQRQLTKGAAANAKKGAAPAPATANAPAATPPAEASTTATSENKPIRSVGPTFLPQQQK